MFSEEKDCPIFLFFSCFALLLRRWFGKANNVLSTAKSKLEVSTSISDSSYFKEAIGTKFLNRMLSLDAFAGKMLVQILLRNFRFAVESIEKKDFRSMFIWLHFRRNELR